MAGRRPAALNACLSVLSGPTTTPAASSPYDTGAQKALTNAKEHGRTVVSMQNDFKVVYDV